MWYCRGSGQVCVQTHTLMHVQARGGCQVSNSSTVYLILLGQGLLVILESAVLLLGCLANRCQQHPGLQHLHMFFFFLLLFSFHFYASFYFPALFPPLNSPGLLMEESIHMYLIRN